MSSNAINPDPTRPSHAQIDGVLGTLVGARLKVPSVAR